MAKYYTEEAQTPVFAVTFVSNRKGIVPPEIITNNTNSNTQTNPEDLPNNITDNDIKRELQEKIDDIKYFKDTILPAMRRKLLNSQLDDNYVYTGDTLFPDKFKSKSVNILREELTKFKNEDIKTFNTVSNGNQVIPTEDVEYLVYSNLQIESIGPNDLSKQSNWYLRDADVELTRDWPVCKAKLIVAAKLNDDGSIPQIKQVEEGFVYNQSVQVKEGKPTNNIDFNLIPGGRFLSADDEVRIYAGYKNDTCITMDDLDSYPFDFETLQSTKPIDLTSHDGKRLTQLETEKKAIEDAISTLNNPLTDTVLQLSVAIPLLVGAGIIAAGGLTVGGVVVGGGTTAASTGSAATAVTRLNALKTTTTATTTSTTTVVNTTTTVAATTAPSLARILSDRAISTIKLLQNAKLAPERFQILKNYQNTLTPSQLETFGRVFKGLDKTTTAAFISAFAFAAKAVTVDAAQAEETTSNNIEADPFKTKPRNYLDGRQSFKDNNDLKSQLNLELASVNNLIQTIQKKVGVEKKCYTSSKDKIAPIFWGFIDSVDFISNSDAGVQIIYNLRDRSRILADTKLVTLPYLNKDNNERAAFEGLRHKTIEGVYRASNGGIYLDNNYISATTMQWREGFDVGEVISLYDNKIDAKSNKVLDDTDKITNIGTALSEQRIKFSAAIEDQARWTLANSFLSSKDIKQNALSKYDPLFHIWTLQPPIVQGGGQSVMQIVNKSPFEILTYLQVTEVMPIDFFSSHVNGHFLFAPRVLDTTGLNDPERGNRLYFFFQCFDKTPEARNLIKDIRVQTSTIGVYNRFAIANAEFNNPTNASLKDLYTVVDIASANTKNRKVPIKQHIIVDPKIKNQANAEGYAQGLALTTASIMARDNTTIIFKVIGDSTFYPGEAVRVYNTVLHGKDTFTFNSQTESSSTFLRDLYQEVQKLKEGNGAVKQGGSQNKVVNLNAVIDQIRKGSGTESDDLNDVLPMYKVRAITHSLKAGGSDAGYTTKIVAIADIL